MFLNVKSEDRIGGFIVMSKAFSLLFTEMIHGNWKKIVHPPAKLSKIKVYRCPAMDDH